MKKIPSVDDADFKWDMDNLPERVWSSSEYPHATYFIVTADGRQLFGATLGHSVVYDKQEDGSWKLRRNGQKEEGE